MNDETKQDEYETAPAPVAEGGGTDAPPEPVVAEVGSSGIGGPAEPAVTAKGGAVKVDELVAARVAGAAPAAEPAPRAADPQLKAIIEALVFASPEPLTPKMLFKLLEGEPREDVELALAALRQDYEGLGGLQLVEVANGFQIVTRPEMHEWVRRLFHERKTQKLSAQALETLAVIAYKQPITAPEIAEIRGVNTAGVLSTLIERRLIKIAGRKPVVGRPFLYATTREFLIRFGLRDLNDLPKVEDLADVLGFEPPAGLSERGPSAIPLPLEIEDSDSRETGRDAPAEAVGAGRESRLTPDGRAGAAGGEPEQVH